MIIERDVLKEIAPRAVKFGTLLNGLNDILPKYSIDTPDRVAAFLAQCGHESSGFRYLEENLNYSAAALRRTFGKYFTKSESYEYSKQPERIANRVYANRMDNGDEESGDGWKYRGRGYIQLTGKRNYTLFAEYMEMSMDDTIAYLETVEGAIESACWYWDRNRLNHHADERDIKRITKLVNGGYHGLESREALYKQALDLLSEEEVKPHPFGGDPNVELRLGDRGVHVENLQRALFVKVDGNFGFETKRYLRKFQRRYGLPDHGEADRLTLTKLYTGL